MTYKNHNELFKYGKVEFRIIQTRTDILLLCSVYNILHIKEKS